MVPTKEEKRNDMTRLGFNHKHSKEKGKKQGRAVGALILRRREITETTNDAGKVRRSKGERTEKRSEVQGSGYALWNFATN